MYEILSQIKSPDDLKTLSRDQLKQVARELRQAIVDHLSQTGGHFASDLGAVELILALHTVYSVPKDKIIWDTGHQCYAHKMLTGRLERFSTLRQYGGISGFLRREESEYDLFGAGHAGTSISAAYGFAVARDFAGKSNEEHVLAVIGDAAMTAGLALEGLHNAGHSGRNFVVVLNDNEMSIAESVGALAKYLAKLRVTPLYQSLESRTRGLLKRIDKTPGQVVFRAAGSVLKHNLTHLVSTENSGVLFEQLGYQYIGPVDGHDLDLLIDLFTAIKSIKGPVFVHLLTVKGKGYEKAEEDARKWHAVTPPMFKETAEGTAASSKSSGQSWTSYFSKTILELAAEDPKIVAITAAMPDGTGLTPFSKQFPDRYFDTAIAEQHAVCFAAGLAAEGMKPITAIYSTFLQRAYDMILHDVAIQNLPVLFCLDRAGLVGDDGPTHHGVFDIAYMRPIPNMALLAPKDGPELVQMLRYMVQEHVVGPHAGPIAVRYPRGNAPSVEWPVESAPIEYGKSEVLLDGGDIALFAYGNMVVPAFEAAKTLRAEGIDAALINLRWAKPLDAETILTYAKKTRCMLVMEEGVVHGGVGSAILELLAEAGVTDVRVKLFGVPDKFIEHGAIPILHQLCMLTAHDFAAAARDLLGKPQPEPVAVAREARHESLTA
ncbi:1-deoxy-D-xylulose-5-phosphate synthase [Chthonomonas calidirosea]|uniref:1-deoxy-D-xylulose-5-phosphate synthase n=1 Tax=Chthonomonas calidirosea (strain DSM 23976 / ICMP 18418 / T49) TaxID=1303518 RepID=S0EYW1_CHTCT|nr:1-deoxy-D-xylulose-5-phosphate synthase [Chthonomonas calidirosea]CCW35751.1 1-deoxy-D-xylulose-5-phosphate synthase [Chthonomonas calidirosea T49]CEK19346.1 1-deoxy-D-xylulose-5-phosphate synthase [Chthonomonas calidirosea]